jgi:DNA repair protein RadC
MMRPRERLLSDGAQALSDAELLAIFLRSGSKTRNAIELSQDLLQSCGGMRALLFSNLEEFSKINGLGLAKWAQFQAAHEIVKRALKEQLAACVVLSSPGLTREFLQTAIGHLPHEVFSCLFLNMQGALIEFKILFRGSASQTTVHPREIIKEALALNANSVIFAHNHPNGIAYPSESDLSLTHTMQGILNTLEIHLLDHCIVTHNGFFSFADAGIL